MILINTPQESVGHRFGWISDAIHGFNSTRVLYKELSLRAGGTGIVFGSIFL